LSSDAQAHHHTNYVKIWGILVALLVVSVLGPMLGIKLVTLIAAFGVAIVKAYLVARHFMHLGIERKWVGYLLVTMLALMLIFVGGVSPDVMKHEGANWENTAAKSSVERGLATPTAHEAEAHEGAAAEHREGPAAAPKAEPAGGQH
jgi:caa(3)-type oxidase subunit IV